jgi:hypothetical protein
MFGESAALSRDLWGTIKALMIMRVLEAFRLSLFSFLSAFSPSYLGIHTGDSDMAGDSTFSGITGDLS